MTGDEVYSSRKEMTSILVLDYFHDLVGAKAFSVNPICRAVMNDSGVVGESHTIFTAAEAS